LDESYVEVLFLDSSIGAGDEGELDGGENVA